MNILLTILIVLGSIIALLLIVALFVKNEYTVQREVTIHKPLTGVFNYVKYLKSQEYFSKWVMTDPQLRKTYTGTDGTVGAKIAWDSDDKQVGKGEQEIKNIIDDERIDCEVRFEKPMKGVAQTFFLTKPGNGDDTSVTWGMKGRSPYPMNLMCLFMPEMLGKDMLISLNTLKTILENQ